MNNKMMGNMDHTLFWSTIILCATVLLIGIVFPEGFAATLNNLQAAISLNFGWLFLLVVAACIVVSAWLALGPHAHKKLGKDDDVPEYSTFSWISMLFSCGIGVGFIFWGVAEPMYHYMQPPYLASPASPESAIVAIQISALHWGIHGWALFVVAGLAIAYSSYRLGQPMTVATALYGLLGKNTEGPWGKLINFLAAFATIAGISTTLGMGILSINFAMTYLFGIEMTKGLTVLAMCVLIGMYIISAATGISRGIKILSNINVTLGFGLLVFVLVFGPTRYFMNLMTASVGAYLENFIFMTFWTDPVNESPWLGWWTVFYWAWWISWLPFVGGFVARISKGRTIREFVWGVILAPTAIAIIWFSVVGGAAIHAEMTGTVPMWAAIQNDIGSGIFVLLQAYPLGFAVSFIVFINLLTFIVSSADSAAFFVAMVMSKGELEPTTPMRIIWGIFIGSLAVILLITGGLKALQTASIVAAFPLAIVVPFIIVSLFKMLKSENVVQNNEHQDTNIDYQETKISL